MPGTSTEQISRCLPGGGGGGRGWVVAEGGSGWLDNCWSLGGEVVKLR